MGPQSDSLEIHSTVKLDPEKDKEKLQKYEDFKKRNFLVLRQWIQAHPENANPPILWDTIINNFRWISRQERKKMRAPAKLIRPK